MGVYAGEQNLDDSEKGRRYRIATSIYGADRPRDAPAEDIAKFKKLIGNGYSTLVVGRAIPMLEMIARAS
jgi:hypothetical protein